MNKVQLFDRAQQFILRVMPEEEFQAHRQRCSDMGNAANPIFEREYQEAEELVSNIAESTDIETARRFLAEASEDTWFTFVYLYIAHVAAFSRFFEDDDSFVHIAHWPPGQFWEYIMSMSL